ncbi:MAG: DNA polymerase I, partial [Anaerolineae bacterium]|nr:DNA polymerase I [Anaerolineae bacterium]
MPPVLYLIDGHALAYRMYFAMTSGGSTRLSTRQGEPTAGTFGFASVMIRLLQEKPDYLAVAFDTGKTFRDKIFPEYKATRAKMPDDLRPQIERIRQLVDAFPFPRLEMEGYEADDVLGSVAKIAVEQGLGVKIITGDRDLLQLVNDRVVVNLPGSRLADSRDYRAEDVVEYLGVRPDQVVDYKALVGDKSDNIPGVAGVGEKTAITLLSRYDTLDAIYGHINEITGRLRERLEKDKETAYMSRDLATIRTNLPVQLDLEKARADHIQSTVVEAMFTELEFRTLINRLHELTGSAPAANNGDQLALFGQPVTRLAQGEHYHPEVTVVDTPEALDALQAKLASAKELAFDTETTSTDPMRAELVGISLAVREGEAFYIPVGHQTGERQLELELVLNGLRPAMTDPGLPKIGQNLKYDV